MPKETLQNNGAFGSKTEEIDVAADLELAESTAETAAELAAEQL